MFECHPFLLYASFPDHPVNRIDITNFVLLIPVFILRMFLSSDKTLFVDWCGVYPVTVANDLLYDRVIC